MGKYATSQKRVIDDTEARKIYALARNAEERKFLVLAWLTGARPIELMALIGSDIGIHDDMFKVRLNTAKLKKDDFRILPMQRNGDFWIEEACSLLKDIKEGEKVFNLSQRRYGQIFNELSEQALGFKISPYHFRHTCLTYISNAYGASGGMAWKGSTDPRSVNFYIHSIPFELDTTKLKRNNGL